MLSYGAGFVSSMNTANECYRLVTKNSNLLIPTGEKISHLDFRASKPQLLVPLEVTNITTTLERNYTGFPSNNESIANSAPSHKKQINNLLYNSLFFRHILCLQDLPILSFILFHMSDHLLAKQFSQILVLPTTLEFNA